jgi:hypothetical protein
MRINKNFILKRVLPVIAGAVLGFSYYYFVGCRIGSCPITGNPWISTGYGSFAGFLLSLPSKKKSSIDTTNKNQ